MKEQKQKLTLEERLQEIFKSRGWGDLTPMANLEETLLYKQGRLTTEDIQFCLYQIKTILYAIIEAGNNE